MPGNYFKWKFLKMTFIAPPMKDGFTFGFFFCFFFVLTLFAVHILVGVFSWLCSFAWSFIHLSFSFFFCFLQYMKMKMILWHKLKPRGTRNTIKKLHGTSIYIYGYMHTYADIWCAQKNSTLHKSTCGRMCGSVPLY